MTRYPANRRVDTGTAATVLKQSDVYRSVQKQLDSGDRLHEATMEAVIADSLGLDKKVVTQVLRSVPLFIRDMLDAGFDVNWASLGTFTVLHSNQGRLYPFFVPNRHFCKGLGTDRKEGFPWCREEA